MSKSPATRARPLSPHLSIYKPIPTMMISIIHRITGCALYAGTVLVAIWLLAASGPAEGFARVQAIYGSWFGIFVLFIYSWILLHHLAGGVRHMVMDTGHGLEKGFSTRLATVLPFLSLGLTVLVWAAAILTRGA